MPKDRAGVQANRNSWENTERDKGQEYENAKNVRSAEKKGSYKDEKLKFTERMKLMRKNRMIMIANIKRCRFIILQLAYSYNLGLSLKMLQQHEQELTRNDA